MRMGLVQKINLSLLGKVCSVSTTQNFKIDHGTTTVGPTYGLQTMASGTMLSDESLQNHTFFKSEMTSSFTF